MATETWNIDPSHSTVGFRVRHMVVSKVRGRFRSFSGTLELDPAELQRSSVKVSIDAASIDTAEEKRDQHLRSADFFDAEKFPKLTFASKRVVADGNRLQVIGELSIHGVTREVTLEANVEGQGKDPWGNERRAFEAHTKINRHDFGLNWNAALEAGGVLVGADVEIELEVQAVRQK